MKRDAKNHDWAILWEWVTGMMRSEEDHTVSQCKRCGLTRYDRDGADHFEDDPIFYRCGQQVRDDTRCGA